MPFQGLCTKMEINPFPDELKDFKGLETKLIPKKTLLLQKVCQAMQC